MNTKDTIKALLLSIIVKLDDIISEKDEARKFIEQLQSPSKEEVEVQVSMVLMREMGCKLWMPWFSYCKVHEQSKFDKSTGVCGYVKPISRVLIETTQLTYQGDTTAKQPSRRK